MAGRSQLHRRWFSEDFKRDAVRLVAEEKYTFLAAAQAVGVRTGKGDTDIDDTDCRRYEV